MVSSSVWISEPIFFFRSLGGGGADPALHRATSDTNLMKIFDIYSVSKNKAILSLGKGGVGEVGEMGGRKYNFLKNFKEHSAGQLCQRTPP